MCPENMCPGSTGTEQVLPIGLIQAKLGVNPDFPFASQCTQGLQSL